jgi:hypothetical protein
LLISASGWTTTVHLPRSGMASAHHVANDDSDVVSVALRTANDIVTRVTPLKKVHGSYRLVVLDDGRPEQRN